MTGDGGPWVVGPEADLTPPHGRETPRPADVQDWQKLLAPGVQVPKPDATMLAMTRQT